MGSYSTALMQGHDAWVCDVISVVNMGRQGSRNGKQSDNLKVIGKSKILNVRQWIPINISLCYSLRLELCKSSEKNHSSHIHSVIWSFLFKF